MKKVLHAACRITLAVFSIVAFTIVASAETDYTLKSPDDRIEVTIHAANKLTYDLSVNGKQLMKDSGLALTIENKALGENPHVQSTKKDSVDKVLEPVVKQKSAKIHEHYNQLRLEMDGGYAVVFRAYPEGVAYRFETSLGAEHVKVYKELAAFRFTDNYTSFYPEEESLFSHNERHYLPHPMAEISDKKFASMPVVVDAGSAKIAIAESDLDEYAGMWLQGTGTNGFDAIFAAYPLKEELSKDRDFKVTERADYIAITKGTRTFPWRVLGVVENDGDLLTNPIVWLLEKPSLVHDTSWIKPGKVSWDWWNANNIYGVDFKAGINTETYKYYIDFAAKIRHRLHHSRRRLVQTRQRVRSRSRDQHGRTSPPTPNKKTSASSCGWSGKRSTINSIPALDQFAKWGVKGIKVDFMQRDDQKLIEYYHKVSREAAKRQMLVDFHGGQKPATMTRTWPNLISTEGVRGMEWSKWSAEVEPQAQRHASVHPNVSRSDGLHSRRHAQRHAKDVRAHLDRTRWLWARAATSSPCTSCTKARCRCFRTVRQIMNANPNRSHFSAKSPRLGTKSKPLAGKISRLRRRLRAAAETIGTSAQCPIGLRAIWKSISPSCLPEISRSMLSKTA